MPKRVSQSNSYDYTCQNYKQVNCDECLTIYNGYRWMSRIKVRKHSLDYPFRILHTPV